MIPRTDLRAQALHVEEAKEKLRHYRRRTPEASTLYQIVYHSREDLQLPRESGCKAQCEQVVAREIERAPPLS
jgi:hypothetical protein